MKNYITIIIILFIEIILFINPNITIKCVKDISIIYILKVFPNMFPTMVMSNILIKQGIINIIPNIIFKLFNKLCNFSNVHTTIFVMSILSGAPTYAFYIKEYLEKKIITEKEANTLLNCCFFINLLFVITGVGSIVFNNIKLGLLLYTLLVIKNIIKLYLNKDIFNTNNYRVNDNNEYIIDSIIKSIKTSISASLNIYGIIIFFNILINIITLKLPIILDTIITSILEMTSGIIKLSSLNIPITYKFIISFLILNFGGICMHIQTINIIKNKKIRYIIYFINRFI